MPATKPTDPKKPKAPARRKAPATPRVGKKAKPGKESASEEAEDAVETKASPASQEPPKTGRALVIVESPAKAKTINKFLGRKFMVRASMGHVRDLPKSKLGVDVKNNFKLTYQPLVDRKHVLDALKEAAAKATAIYLAPDPDREGEAIAWHLKEAIDLPKTPTYRVTFNSITKDAVTKAFENPRKIDMALVDAQQARRVLDRLVGYGISPLLWKKVTRGLSAGRVQSVALGLIVDREREIRAFRSQPYWKVTAKLSKPGTPPAFEAPLERIDGQPAKTVPADDPKGMPKEVAEGIAKELLGGATDIASATPVPFRVTSVERKERLDRPKPPFTTSTLQQQASIVLRYGSKRTMMLAQRLYEGIPIPGEGPVALITYMRTDSLNVAPEAIAAAREHVGKVYGATYLPEQPNRYKAGGKAQEAHEAVRPTEPSRTPESLKGLIDPAQWRLYDLIWRRFMGSQMTPGRIDTTTVEIAAGRGMFRAKGEVVVFDGCTRVYGTRGDAEALPAMGVGDALHLDDLPATAHETQPPPRYTEAGLVKALEQDGVGRPSTYATIIGTIQDRGYVKIDQRKFFATPLGEVVTDLLRPAFPELFRIDFTAGMEDDLDRIEEGADWKKVIGDFYKIFAKELEKAGDKMPDCRSMPAPADMKCPVCDAPMVMKWSSKSHFYGCTRWPECEGKRGGEGEHRVAPEATSHVCPKCGKPLVIRTGRRGRFFACSGYPECKATADIDEQGNPIHKPSLAEAVACPKCTKPMVLRYSRRGPFLGCSGYPRCRGTQPLTEEQAKTVPAFLAKRLGAWQVPGEPADTTETAPGKPEEGDPSETEEEPAAS